MSNSKRSLVAIALLAILATVSAQAASPPFSILYHEGISVKKERATGSLQHLSFDAYGRHFDLLLESNVRIRAAVPPGMESINPLQGTVAGAAGSWVRLTGSSSGWRGMFFDGHEFFAIEPAADIADSTVQPLNASGTAPVIFRLADALLPLGAASCETVTSAARPTAAHAMRALAAELQNGPLATMKRVSVGVVADFEFAHAFSAGVTPEDAIIARMNIVDGIFSSQVGVKINLAPPTVFRQSSEPFTHSKASDLLMDVSNYRARTPQQMSLGLTHLMTGRALDGTTVGIAYIGTVCSGADAASLSEGTHSTTTAALIAAHEIGHNFNAPHDGETGSACASTPTTFLMAPQINGSDHFSACSVQQMSPLIQSASCLTPYTPPDVGVVVAAGTVAANVSTAFAASFSVQALGDDASNDVAVTATLPAQLALQSASAAAGTCASGAGTVTCTLGVLAPGETRAVTLNLVGATAGAATIDLALTSSNDTFAPDNAGTIDVSLTQPPPPAVPAGGPAGGSAPGGAGGSGASGSGGTSGTSAGSPPASGAPASSSGGGGLDAPMLAFLGGILVAGARRRLRAPQALSRET